MENLNITQVCENCGAVLGGEAQSNIVVCSYCNSSFDLSINTKEIETDMNYTFIVPFSVDKNAANIAFIKWLIDDKFPCADIYDYINRLKIRPIYIPMYKFMVDYDFRWSASVGFDREEVYYEGNERRTRIVTDWMSDSGNINGEYTKNIIATDSFRKGASTSDFISKCDDMSEPGIK